MPPHDVASATRLVDPTQTAASSDAARQLHAFTGPLDEETIAALASTLQDVTPPAGGELFRQGEPGAAVFFVASGRSAAVVTRDDGQRVRIGEVGAGESVGEMALLSGQLRKRYIANFFRSRQKIVELFEPPFLFAQQAEIPGGWVPQGPP